MKNSSILLAIGVVVALVAFGAGIHLDSRVPAVSKAVAGFIAADNGAALQRLRLAGMVREVTAYNVGVPDQTSATPCVGASGKDLCRMVEEGRKVCAANFVSLGTVLHIDDYGECVVLDRMNRRFSHRVDIAMAEDAVDDAVAFGVRKLVVRVKD